ncbi:MAG: FG-GAP-like repeat-containing protein [Acidobacteriota bacterium]
MRTAGRRTPKARKSSAAAKTAAKPHGYGGGVAAQAGGEGDEGPKEPATAEALAKWTFVEGTAISPVLSPPLRDIPPLQGTQDAFSEVNNPQLPHRIVGNPGDGPARPDGALQTSIVSGTLAPTGVNFEGISANGSAPSDDNGRVGPNHYVQWVNSQFAVYDKSGSILYGPAKGNTLFTSLGGVCAAQNNGDPVVNYDILADRWVLSQFAVDAPPTGLASHQCVAVSVTGDALGAYYLYDFPLSATLLFDYPHVGVWPDGYYTTYHVFDQTKPAAQQYQNQGLVVFERLPMIAGAPARVQVKSIGTAGAQEFGGALPADIDSLLPPPAGSPGYILAPGSAELDGSTGPMIHFWTATTTWGVTPTVTISGPTNITTASFTGNLCNFARACLSQPPPAVAADSLDAISDRFLFRIGYRNFGDHEALVMNHTVNAAVPPANQAGVRWYEIRTPGTTPTIFQQGTYSPDANHRWMGSIAMDNGGNMAAGYSKSSTTVIPEIDVAGRLAGDALGTLGSELQMQPGVGVQIGTANRWGDYTAMTVDPREGCTFWYTNQYIPANGSFNWHSRIAAFRFPAANCSAPSRGTLTGTVTDGTGRPIAGAVVSLDNGFSGATNASGVYTIVLPPGSYNATAAAALRIGCNPSASAPVVVPNGGSATKNFVLTGTADVVVASAAFSDAEGNNNGRINRNECLVVDVTLSDIGCASATGVSAVLTSSTPGVTVVTGASAYPDLPAGGSSPNATHFQIRTDNALICGDPLNLTLTVTSSAGPQVFPISFPTCDAPIIQAGAITAADSTQTARLGRFAPPSVCGTAKTCPGPFSTGTRHFDSYTYTNTAATTRCITVDLAPTCSQAATQLFSAAYLGTYDPANLCTNYLADPASSPLNGGIVSYSFDIAAGATFVVVVNEVNQDTFCSSYTIKVAGLDDLSDGGAPAAPAITTSAIEVKPASTGNTASVPDAGPGASYLWTIQGGTITGGQGTRTITFTAGSAGSVVLSISETIASGCNAPSTVKVVPIIAGDFNVDGFSDLLWRRSTGENTIWQLNGTSVPAGATAAMPSVADPNWQVGAVADYSLDGNQDLLWRNGATGQNTLWLMNGTTVVTQVALPTIADTNWQIRASGDLDGDGKADIVWRNGATGQNTIWIMNGTALASQVPLPAVADVNWQIYGTGDFNGDGKTDILWRNGATGEDVIWIMNGNSVASQVSLPSIFDLNWKISGVADYNADGKSDIVWRNQSTGQNSIWVMNGTVISSQVGLPDVVDVNWKIAGPK